VLVVLVLPTTFSSSLGSRDWAAGCRRSRREIGTAAHRLLIGSQSRTPGLGEPSRGLTRTGSYGGR
jgi:hypothetical protein